jgi:hypothetical protein
MQSLAAEIITNNSLQFYKTKQLRVASIVLCEVAHPPSIGLCGDWVFALHHPLGCVGIGLWLLTTPTHSHTQNDNNYSDDDNNNDDDNNDNYSNDDDDNNNKVAAARLSLQSAAACW